MNTYEKGTIMIAGAKPDYNCEGTTHSYNMNELFTALSKAQAMILTASKDSTNPFFKSKYSDLTAVWEACRGPLTANGLCIIQTIEGTKEALFIVTWLGHSSGQWMSSKLPLMPTKADHQSVGSAISYGKRYALSAMVGVVSGDDDDGEAAMKAARKPEPVKVDEKKIIRDFMEKVLPEDDANEEAWINQYLQAHAKINKCPIYVSIQKYDDIDKFKLHLSQWKEKQMKSEDE